LRVCLSPEQAGQRGEEVITVLALADEVLAFWQNYLGSTPASCPPNDETRFVALWQQYPEQTAIVQRLGILHGTIASWAHTLRYTLEGYVCARRRAVAGIGNQHPQGCLMILQQ